MPTKKYLDGSRLAVYKALWGLGLYKWSSHLEVRNYGRQNGIPAPDTEQISTGPYGSWGTGGGHSVWEYTDRTKRHLEWLVKKEYIYSRNGKYKINKMRSYSLDLKRGDV